MFSDELGTHDKWVHMTKSTGKYYKEEGKTVTNFICFIVSSGYFYGVIGCQQHDFFFFFTLLGQNSESSP